MKILLPTVSEASGIYRTSIDEDLLPAVSEATGIYRTRFDEDFVANSF